MTKKNKTKDTEKEFRKLAKKYKDEGKYQLSIENYNKFLELHPNNLDALKELGDVYEKVNNFLLAVDIYKKFIKYDKNNLYILNQIGLCYYNMRNYKESIAYFKKVLEINYNIGIVHVNLGLTYIGNKNTTEAEKSFKTAFKYSDINDEKIYGNLANLYFYSKKYDLSKLFYDKELKIKREKCLPESDIQKNIYNKSFCYLAKKEFETGFSLHENRLFSNNIHPQTNEIERVEIPDLEYWNGLNDPCENLYIIYEQGLGDNVQYFRFILELVNIKPNLKIFYFMNKRLIAVFKRFDKICSFIELSKYDLLPNSKKVYIMSLPYYLGTREILPNNYNYINLDDKRNQFWKEQFKSLKRMKVGIVGSGLLISLFEKKISLKEFSELFDLDIDFIYIGRLNDLENDASYEEIKKCQNLHFYDIDKKVPFIDTIPILKNIDLLISVDTITIHLAGVMNIKSWCLLGYYSDWRWSTDDFSYWYSSVELLRVTEQEKELGTIIPFVKTRLISELELYKNNTLNNI